MANSRQRRLARRKERRNKPLDRWLGIGGIVAGILLFLVAKTPAAMVVCVVAVFCLLVHPVWKFWWIEDRLWRRILAIIGLVVSCGAVGYTEWPSKFVDTQPLTKKDVREVFQEEQMQPPPNFEIILSEALFNYNERLNLTEVLLSAAIYNSGGPSTTTCWFIHYQSSTLDKNLLPIRPAVQPIPFLIGRDPTIPNRGLAVEFYSVDSIVETTAVMPVVKGSPAFGRFLINVPNDRRKEIRSRDALITVTVCDSLHNQVESEYRYNFGPNDHPHTWSREKVVVVDISNVKPEDLPPVLRP